MVVLLRRGTDPWAKSLRLYLILAGFVVAIRLFFAVVFSSSYSGNTLFTLPQIKLPQWLAGIRIGGPVSDQVIIGSLANGLQLASIFVLVGAAMSLANPRRALRSVPPALYELSVSVVVALTVAPQLVESIARIRRAQRLRGELPKGLRQLVRIGIPALEDAVDRSLSLAAGMESRGFGRTNGRRRSSFTPILLMAACVAIPVGAYLVLSNLNHLVGGILLVLGLGTAVAGIRLAGRGVIVTRYRPDPWGMPEWALSACGLGVAGIVTILASTYKTWATSLQTNSIPNFDPLMLGVAALAAAPLLFTAAPAATRPEQEAEISFTSHDLRRLRGQEVTS